MCLRLASLQGSQSRPRGAIRQGVLTAISTASVSGSAAAAGALLSRHFGHGAKTDGFFAATLLRKPAPEKEKAEVVKEEEAPV